MDNFRAVEKEEQGAKKKLKLKEEAPPVTDCSLGCLLYTSDAADDREV